MSNTRLRFEPTWAWFIAALMVGLSLRLFRLDHQSLWLDEMTSIQIAQMPLQDVFNGRRFDNHTPPLYYVLLHYWQLVVPLNERGLRLFSVGIDVLNVCLLWVLCRRYISMRLSLLVISAYALSPFALYYAQEGRMYTLAVFFSLLYALTIERLVSAGRGLALWSLAAGIVLALGVYTHYYMVFYAFAVVVVALFAVRNSWRRIASIVLSGFFGIVLFSPWIPIAVRLAESDGQIFRPFLFSVIPYTVFRFVIGYAVFPINSYTKENFASSVMANLPILIAVFGTLILLGWSALRRIKERKHLALAAGWIVIIPSIVGLLLSLKVPMLSERYLIVIFPLFLLLCVGFQDLTQMRSWVTVGLFFLLLVAGDVAYFANPNFGKAQWRDAAQYVQENSRRDDVIVFHSGYIGDLFRYYYRGLGEFRRSENMSRNELLGRERLWLVVAHAQDGEEYWKNFRRTHRIILNRFYPFEVGIRVLLLERDGEKPTRLSRDGVGSRHGLHPVA